MPRKYEKRKRAEKQAQTRQRIVEAAVDLHGSVGPAQTSVSAIADKAGVQRLTVYRHFPDERSIFRACTGHFFRQNPMPDPEGWRAIDDPFERLRLGLLELFAYWRKHSTLFSLGYRDAGQKPELFEVSPFLSLWQQLHSALREGWRDLDDEKGRFLDAVLGHALDFPTWQSLVERQGLSHEEAVEMMACLVRCAVDA